MQLLADAIRKTFIDREFTDDERAAIGDILDAAVHWADGRLPLWQFAEFGKLPAWNAAGRRVDSAGYGRMLALMATPPDDPRWPCLRDAIDALVRQQDVTMTRHGAFTREELDGSGVVVR